MIFAGEFEHRIDQQGRLSIPARFRPAFEEGIILGRAYDRCVLIYTPGEWERHAAEITSQPQTRSDSRRLARLTFSGAYPSTLDRHGRVVVPQPLRDYAGLGVDVVIVGAGRFIEVWNATAWADERAALDRDASGIAEQVARPTATGRPPGEERES